MPAPKEYEFGFNRGEPFERNFLCSSNILPCPGNPEHFVSRYEQSKDHRFRTRVSPDLKQPTNMILSTTRCAGATHMEGMANTILSTTMDPAMKIFRNTQRAVGNNRPDIPNTHHPTMFSQTNQMYSSLPKIHKLWTQTIMPNTLQSTMASKQPTIYYMIQPWISGYCAGKKHLYEGNEKEVVFNLKEKRIDLF